jgi:hypothetical protein
MSDGRLAKSSRSQFPDFAARVRRNLGLVEKFSSDEIYHCSKDTVALSTFLPMPHYVRYDKKTLEVLTEAVIFTLKNK